MFRLRPPLSWAAPEEDWKRFECRPITQRGTLPDQEDIDQTRCALAMVENQDMNVGRVLSKLEELNLSDTTIIVYFSDNGPNSWRWNDGMKGRKGSTDEGVRSVCYLRWPARLPAGLKGARDCRGDRSAADTHPACRSPACEGPRWTESIYPPCVAETETIPDRQIFSTWASASACGPDNTGWMTRGNYSTCGPIPGRPVRSRRAPELTASLREAVRNWRAEMFPESTKNGAQGRNAVDPRPIGVGYREFRSPCCRARRGTTRCGPTQQQALNSSYFVNWKSIEDEMVWLVDVQTSGRYEVTIDYTCPIEDAGSTIELRHGERALIGKVEPGWDPPLYTNQDTPSELSRNLK
ncbi:MAG: sulfatase-like hydrolase/transferase [Planctomycetaceae bacterium]